MSAEWKEYSAAEFRKTVENISLLEKTGVLEIQDDSSGTETKSYFFFISNGEILYIKESPVDSDNRIGNVLMNREYISHDQLSATLKMQQDNQYEFLGDILMKQGYITPSELLETLTYQIENMVFQIAFISDGRLSFSEGEIPQRMPQIPYTITLSSLLMIFLSSCELQKNHPHISGAFDFSYSTTQEMKTATGNSLETTILGLFSKRQNIKGIFEALPFHNHLSLLKTIISLEERGMLHKRENIPPPPPVQKRPAQPAPKPESVPARSTDMALNQAVNEAMNQLAAEEKPQVKKAKTTKKILKKPHMAKPVQRKDRFQKKTVQVKQRPGTRPAKIRKTAPAPVFTRSTDTHSPFTYIIAKAMSFMVVFVVLSLYISVLHPLLSRMLIRHTLFTTDSFDGKVKTEYTMEVLRRVQSGKEDILTDAWGNIIEVRDGFAISPGPDGLFETADDLRQ